MTHNDDPDVTRYREIRALRARLADLEARVQAHPVLDATMLDTSGSTVQEREDPFARMFHASPIGICITTFSDGRLVALNERYAQILGYSRAELLDERAAMLNCWREPADDTQVMQAIRAQGFYRHWGTQVVNKAGQVRDVLVAVERMVMHGQACLLTMMDDITEQRQLEREREALITQLNDTLHRTDRLYQVTALLNRTDDLNLILQTVVAHAAAALPAHRILLITVDSAAQQVKHRIEGGAGAMDDSTITFAELWEGLSGVVLREYRAVLSRSGAVDSRESAVVRQRREYEQAGSILVVPIQSHGTMLGTLTAIQRPDDLDFTERDSELLSALANQAASAIERASLRSELQQQATTDGLTCLLNRRAWLAQSERVVAAARRTDRPVAVILLDVDHFKRINDTYGHDGGDRVLQGLSDCCQRAVRTSDLVGRYGGEELVMLLPETDGPTALQVAERVRGIVAAEPISMDGQEVAVTISGGGAVMQGEAIDLRAMLTAADRALYAAKQAGRNCVRMAVS